MIPSAAQLRAARVLLGRSQPTAAAAAGVPPSSVQVVENGGGEVRTVVALQKAFEAAGIVFLERDGVQRAGSKPEVEPSEPIEVVSASTPQERALPELMTIREVIAFVKVHRCTIYEWINEGRFPKGIKMAEKVVRWRRDEVMAWFGALERHG